MALSARTGAMRKLIQTMTMMRGNGVGGEGGEGMREQDRGELRKPRRRCVVGVNWRGRR